MTSKNKRIGFITLFVMMARIESEMLLWLSLEGLQLDGVLQQMKSFFEELSPRRGNLPVQYRTRYDEKKNSLYIWFHPGSKDVAYVLCGKNPNGSDRIEQIPDPNWTRATSEEITAKQAEIDATHDWATMAELEDELNLMKMNNCPMIRQMLPPLVQSPYKFVAGWAKSPPGGHQTNKLITNRNSKISNISRPTIIQMLLDNFTWFVTSNTTALRKVYDPDQGKTVRKSVAYPWVDIDRSGKVYITFDPATNDAVMALLLSPTYSYVDDDNSTVTLRFWYNRVMG